MQSERVILSQNQILFQYQIGFRFLERIERNSSIFQKREYFDQWRNQTQGVKSGVDLLTKLVQTRNRILKCQSMGVMRISLKELLHSERREVMRSECDVLASQTSQKQQESQHYFNILFNHLQDRIKHKFSEFDFSIKGRINRVQLALLLRDALNQTAFYKISDRQILEALATSFTLYFGTEPPSSPVLGDVSSLSLSECISLKQIIQHKLKHFLKEILKRSTDPSTGFKTPRSFVEYSSPLSPLAQSTPTAAQFFRTDEHTLASRVEKITNSFQDYDILRENALSLEATVLMLKTELFSSLSGKQVYEMLEHFVDQQKNEPSYSPKITKIRREELIQMAVSHEQQPVQGQATSPLTMSDIQSSSRTHGPQIQQTTPRIGVGLPRKQFEKEQESSGSSSSVFQRPTRSLFKLNKPKLEGKLRTNKQERGVRGLTILSNRPLRAQDLNESTAHTPKSTEDNTSAQMQERVLQMQSDISLIKKETDALRCKLSESQSSPHNKDQVVLPKDLVASLLQQNIPKKKPKKKRRGSSLNSKGIMVQAPLEKVILTRKGGGGYTLTRRISHSPTYLESGRRGRCIEGVYKLEGRRNETNSMDSLNQSACRSRYCLVCRGDPL